MFTVVFHPLVELDITDAYEWYENEKTGLGEEFATILENKKITFISSIHHSKKHPKSKYRKEED